MVELAIVALLFSESVRSMYFIKKKRLNTNEESKRRDALKTPYNYRAYTKMILHGVRDYGLLRLQASSVRDR